MADLRSDEPTLDDRLNRAALVQRVGDLVRACETPHVFGVHGDWGAGKTSFLHQLQLYLTGECPQQTDLAATAGRTVFANHGVAKDYVTVVWFEAWRYQHEAAPVVALLHEIRSQLSWALQMRKKVGKLSEVAIRSALLAMEDLTKKIYIQTSKIQQVGETWERDNLAVALPSHVIREHLEKEIRTLLGDKKDASKKDPGEKAPRLVVMVDDLDRCASDAAYRLLEGIKIYLNLKQCVFVLGMNQKVIEDAIAAHLPKEGESAARIIRAREYLEKLCQTIHHLPLVRDPETLLDQYLQGVKEKQRIFQIVQAHKPLPANPRKIKGFANIVRRSADGLEKRLLNATDPDRSVRLFVYVACLYYFHPDVFRVLEAEPKFSSEIKRWTEGNPTTHDVLSRLKLPMSPPSGGGPANPTATPTLAQMFYDPGEPTTFRLQELVRALDVVTTTEIIDTINLL
jgi:KAP family P-loop domain